VNYESYLRGHGFYLRRFMLKEILIMGDYFPERKEKSFYIDRFTLYINYSSMTYNKL